MTLISNSTPISKSVALIISHDKGRRRQIKNHLYRNFKLECMERESCGEALDSFHLADMVLLDDSEPFLRRLKFLDLIRNLECYCHLPVLLLHQLGTRPFSLPEKQIKDTHWVPLDKSLAALTQVLRVLQGIKFPSTPVWSKQE